MYLAHSVSVSLYRTNDLQKQKLCRYQFMGTKRDKSTAQHSFMSITYVMCINDIDRSYVLHFNQEKDRRLIEHVDQFN